MWYEGRRKRGRGKLRRREGGGRKEWDRGKRKQEGDRKEKGERVRKNKKEETNTRVSKFIAKEGRRKTRKLLRGKKAKKRDNEGKRIKMR